MGLLAACLAMDGHAISTPTLSSCSETKIATATLGQGQYGETDGKEDSARALTALLRRGQLAAVIEAVDKEPKFKQAAGPLSIQALALSYAGYSKRALATATEANYLAKRTADERLRYIAQINVAIVYAKAGAQNDALALFEEVAKGAEGAGLSVLQAMALTNQARIGIDNGIHAVSHARVAEDIANRKLGEVEKIDVMLSVGSVWLDLVKRRQQHAHEAAEMLTRTYGVASELGDRRALSQTLSMLAVLHSHMGDSIQGIKLIDRAIAVFRGDDVRAEAKLYWQKAQFLQLAGRHPGALEYFRKATALLQASRADVELAMSAEGSAFGEGFGALYSEFADLLLREARYVGSAKTELLREARDILEQSKTVELVDYFHDPCIAASMQNAKAAEDADPGAAIIYPIILPDRIELLLSHKGIIEQIVIPVEKSRVLPQIQLLRQLLEKRSTRQYLLPSRLLHEWLIAPLTGRLASIMPTTLVIVPDKTLRTIPFAALHDGERFLIERYAIAVTPSLSLTNPRSLSQTAWHPSISGLTVASQGFSALPAVAGELLALEAMLGVSALRDTEFVQANLERKLLQSKTNIIHIASHAQFSSDVNDTFLLTYDGKLTLASLRNMLSVSRKTRDEPLELLSLSACQTAAGDDRAALGLAGVAIQAGARSAFASLWFVNDEFTGQLVPQFYRNLRKSGTTKAQALQEAQISMLQDERFSHPAYWAAFLIIGNWQ